VDRGSLTTRAVSLRALKLERMAPGQTPGALSFRRTFLGQDQQRLWGSRTLNLKLCEVQSPRADSRSVARACEANGGDVMLYFWDERDGEKFSGWWFGPQARVSDRPRIS